MPRNSGLENGDPGHEKDPIRFTTAERNRRIWTTRRCCSEQRTRCCAIRESSITREAEPPRGGREHPLERKLHFGARRAPALGGCQAGLRDPTRRYRTDAA